MAAQTSKARTSAAELQLMMEHPSEMPIRRYAVDVFGGEERAGRWLASHVPTLAHEVPDALLASGDAESMRRVLTILVQIDYGMVN